MGDDDFEDKSEETKGCVSLCLPSNYQDYYYGNIPKEELEYRTLESARTEFPNLEIYEEQPFCTADTKDCYEYCKVKCFNLFAEEDEQFKQDQEQDDENADHRDFSGSKGDGEYVAEGRWRHGHRVRGHALVYADVRVGRFMRVYRGGLYLIAGVTRGR